MKYKFDIIIPVFQKAELLSLCLQSLHDTITQPTHIILINDGSPEECIGIMETYSLLDNHDIIYSIKNHSISYGCPKSLNEGLKFISPDTDFIVFADSDVIFTNNWQEEIAYTFSSDTAIGGVGGILLYPQTGGIQNSGISFFNYWGRHLFLNNLPDKLNVNKIFQVQATVFAFFATKPSIIQQVGLIDEGYFNGYEDWDYQTRIRKCGYNIVINSNIRLYHWEKSNGVHRETARKQNLGRFWSLNHTHIEHDLWNYIYVNLPKGSIEESYVGIDLSEARNDAKSIWENLKKQFNIEYIQDYSGLCSVHRKIWLPDILSIDSHCNPKSIIFLCDNFTQLTENKYWYSLRSIHKKTDIIIDMYANVISFQTLSECFWPGNKIR